MPIDLAKALTELPCMVCDEKAIQWVSIATWKCMKCGKDNSLWYVLAAQALYGKPEDIKGK